MPTPRAHGGAPLAPIPLVNPGQFGLNTQAEASLLGPEWATLATNAIFDTAGRLAARNGFLTRTTTPVAGIVMRIFEYIKADGTAELIFSTDADIFSGVDGSSVEGTLGITEGNIKFVNFNDKCIALGTGTSSNPSIYTGTGNFTTVTVSSGTAPTSGVGTSAYGRLWVVDSDGKTIRYSSLLDETDWDTTGGTINMSSVWPNGQDEVIAIEEFAGDLVVFGRRQIVIWTDGAGGDLGINPTKMYVSDTIPNVGAVSQFTQVHVDGDLWFMSPSGLQSLQRAMQDKTTPTLNLSKNVQNKYLAYLKAESDDNDLSLVYAPRQELVLAIFPGSDKVLAFDTRGRLQDGMPRVTEWSTDLQTAVYLRSRDLNGSLTGTVGEIFNYTGYQDDGVDYSFSYESGWLDLGLEMAQYLKIVKRLVGYVFVGNDTEVTYTLKYDFNTKAKSYSVSVSGDAPSEFNIAEFTDSGSGIGYKDPAQVSLGESEFSGGIALRAVTIPGRGTGQYIKVGVTLDTSGGEFALQQINLFTKVGRIAT
jgi:hypothetical protein